MSMQNSYYAGRINLGVSNALNYRQIATNMLHNALTYNADSIIFNTNSNMVGSICDEMKKLGLPVIYSTVNGESLIIIELSDAVLVQAKSFGLI